jgi:DNA-binding GntR family transcriptional regulator
MSGQIAARLRDQILAGVYTPGAALLQDSIAAQFGVSKIPVREALLRLRAEGLIDIHAHRGFQVRALAASEMDEVFRLRMALEPAAVAEGARRADDAEHEVARTALERLNRAPLADNVADAGNLNAEFHLALVVARVQPVTAEILSRLHTMSQRYVQLHLLPAGRVRRATREHNALFRAWATGLVKETVRLTRRHIEETHRELLQAFGRERRNGRRS